MCASGTVQKMKSAIKKHGFGRLLLLIGGLFALWLLMSGVYLPLTIGFGLLSSILCVWLIAALGLINKRALYRELYPVRCLRYVFWLIVEIGKADWAVAKVILSSVLPKEQRLIAVPASQRTDFGKMLFANSITITPGTITVETESDHFIVHALTAEAADMSGLEHMGNKVCDLERDSAGESH